MDVRITLEIENLSFEGVFALKLKWSLGLKIEAINRRFSWIPRTSTYLVLNYVS